MDFRVTLVYNVGVLIEMASSFLSLSLSPLVRFSWKYICVLFFILQIKKENIIASNSCGHLSDK